jgi:hypothetical protein
LGFHDNTYSDCGFYYHARMRSIASAVTRESSAGQSLSAADEFRHEATRAREKAERATDVYRDLLIAIAESYELLAHLQDVLANQEPLP